MTFVADYNDPKCSNVLQSGETSMTATPDDSQSDRIDEETEVGQEPSTVIVGVESPPLSPLHDHQYDRHYLKPSDPIPIGSSHTVSGHEAMDLAKKLSAELANQAQSYGYNRAVSPDAEPRARSYDHHSQKNKDKCNDNNNIWAFSVFVITICFCFSRSFAVPESGRGEQPRFVLCGSGN